MFTDVPKLKEKNKRRKWLDPLLSLVSYQQKNTYRYLYLRTFLRSSDYLGLYIRLTVIGIFILLSLTSLLPQLIGAGLFVYMTGFQLSMLRKQHDHIIWHDLYPLANTAKNDAIQQLLQNILLIQTAVFALIGLMTSGITSFVGIIVVCLLIMLLIRKYYKKMLFTLETHWD